ncbi:prepilin-type N-terminal cleavage/methylation domain-containing protein [Thermodesulfobacteriota bacterium]
MTTSKGYTMVEMLVGLVLLGALIVAALTLVSVQSKHGGEVTYQRTARESVSLALMMIRNDVLHSGFGVVDRPELSFFMKRNKSSDKTYKQLYVNWGRYLTEDTTSTTNVFKHEAFFTGKAGSYYEPTSNKITKYDVGYLIEDGKDVMCLQYDTTLGKFNVRSLDSYGECAGAASLKWDSRYAPALGYICQDCDDATKFGALVRNGQVIFGGDDNLRATDLSIRALFYDESEPDPAKKEKWSPNPNGITAYEFDQFDADELRAFEISLTYQMRQGRGAALTNPITTVMRVSPRSIVLTKH